MVHIKNNKDQIVVEKVYNEGQEHVFRFWDELNEVSRERLMNQLRHIDFGLIQSLQEKLKKQKKHDRKFKLEPAEVITLPETLKQKKERGQIVSLGHNIIRQGKVAAFLVAGGQGTRLGFDGPKGCFPIGPVTGKSLFQLHAEKIRAANQTYNVTIPWYIMTSETNDKETRTFFQKYQFFGLQEKDVFFFKQRMLPALDDHGKFILSEKDQLFMSPNGHGGSLLALMESGAIDDMKRRRIEIISYFQVDNVMIRIIDPVFIGYHCQAQSEMSSKMVRKKNPHEKVGVFGMADGRLTVVEYSDMSSEDMTAVNPDGSLKYDAGSIAIHLLDVAFAESQVKDGFKLPYHVAHKKIPCINESGEIIDPENPNGYKFETFIFDALREANHPIVVEVNRKEEFSPVKNHLGNSSPETARQDLTNYFGAWLELAGVAISRNNDGDVIGRIEVSPLFAENTEEFKAKITDHFIFDGSAYFGT